MRKILRLLFVAIIGLGLSSCNLDRVETYSFENEVNFNFEDEEVQKDIKDYINGIIPKSVIPSFNGNQYDATVYGIDIFTENYKAIDEKVIMRKLLKSGDAVQYAVVLNGKSTKEVMGYYTWTK